MQRMRVNATREQAKRLKVFCTECKKQIQQEPLWILEWEGPSGKIHHELKNKEIYVGRSKDYGPPDSSFIELNKEDKYWSRLHFLLFSNDNSWRIQNKSGAGTGVESGGRKLLLQGDESTNIADHAVISTQNQHAIVLKKSN